MIWVPFITSLVLLLILFFAVEKILIRVLRKFTAQTPYTWDDILLDRLQKPVLFLLFFVALGISLGLAPSHIKEIEQLFLTIKVALVASAAWSIDRLVGVFTQELPALKKLGNSPQSLLRNIFRGIIYVVAALATLDTFGFSITPLLASLGVGSVAVALALQDTLSNFFSGLYILADQPVRLGDFVQLENGTEGYIEKIGWRSTHLKQLSNNIIVIPNSKLGSSQIINFSLNETECAVLLQMGVAYHSNLEKVEAIVAQVGNEVMSSVNGAVKSFEPFIRYHTFADSSINFTVILRAQTIVDQHLIKHEFIKAIHKRFAQEEIEIPFPQRVVHQKAIK